MIDEFKIVILGDPFSVNQTYKTSRKGRAMYLSDDARVYANSARYQAKHQFARQEVLRQDLEVTFYYYFKSKAVRDHLNFNKLLCDSLNQVIWQDDRQIKISHHYTKYDKKNPRMELYIKETRDYVF